MTIVKHICADCEAVFEFEPNPKFPRKYCSPCGVARKKSWDESSKTPMPQKTLPAVSKEEYHLTIEQTRSNALKCAIDCLPKESSFSMILSTAETFENYILRGIEKQE